MGDETEKESIASARLAAGQQCERKIIINWLYCWSRAGNAAADTCPFPAAAVGWAWWMLCSLPASATTNVAITMVGLRDTWTQFRPLGRQWFCC